ncbi:MAG: phage tail spike protein [Anaerorhabdus sp.]|uniref:phage tail spike protein n=1 Tax=Anaerorhabdus sp. TaxID=1872524 RepID=UPI003A8A8FE9
MIEIYQPTNNNFEMNGDAVLSPLSCILNQQLNGVWSIELENPIDEWLELIVENAVIRCDIPNQKNQLFRINDIQKTDNSVIATALPIFLDSGDELFYPSKSFNNESTQTILNDLLKNTKYSGKSNCIGLHDVIYENANLMQILNADDENSLIKLSKGEILYDNHKVTINQKIGVDNNLRAEFGFNLKGISESINMDNVATRIVPVGYEGLTIGPPGYVDSELIGVYPKIFTKVLHCDDVKVKENPNDDEGYATLQEAQNELIRRANEQFENGVDLPSILIEVDMVDLSKTDEYSEFSNLLKVSLGDTVHCRHRRLGINIDARVIGIEYDCIYQEVTKLIIGNYQPTYFDKNTEITQSISTVIDSKNKTLIAEKITGTINALTTKLAYQKGIAQKQDVRAILFEDFDYTSPTYGALSIGSLGFQISNKRTTDDLDWDWRTVGTADGFYADYITGNEITGLTINGGLIKGAEIKALDRLYFGNDTANIKFNWFYNPNGYTGVIISGNADMTFSSNSLGFSSSTSIYVDGYKTFDADITVYNWDGDLIKIRFKKGMGWFYEKVAQSGNQVDRSFLFDGNGVAIRDGTGKPVQVRNGLLFKG